MDVDRWGMTHQTIVQRRRQFLKVEPNVEGAGGRNLDLEVKILETLEDMVTLCFEVLLECELLLLHMLGVEQWNRSQLHPRNRVRPSMTTMRSTRYVRMVCASIQERARLREGRDQILRSDYPADTPTGQTPILVSGKNVFKKVVRKAQGSEVLYLG